MVFVVLFDNNSNPGQRPGLNIRRLVPAIKVFLFRCSVFIFICFKKTYPLHTLHELARLMQKLAIFSGVKNGKSLLEKE